MTADSSISRTRKLLKCPKCPKYDKTCLIALLKHSCWSAIVLGCLMMALGIVLRSSLVNANTPTVASSGLLFIVIGIFIICMGPFAATYDLITKRRNNNRNARDSEAGATSSSQSTDPPAYNEVVTALKTPSATYNMRFTQLSAKNLSETQPPPPTYEEIVEKNPNVRPVSNEPPLDTRRMTAP